MKQPTAKAIVFFIGALLVGYALAIPVATAILQAALTLTSLANITAFAILFAVLMTVWLDKPLELELINWPEKKPEAGQRPVPAQPLQVQPQPEAQQPATGRPSETEPVPSVAVKIPQTRADALFPHEVPTEHWDVDFGNSKEVYEGAELPVWILAGWAVFILWAVIYLISGLPTAF